MIGRYSIFYWDGRQAGKSYAVTEFFIKQFKDYGREFYWLRLTETATKKLLNNNAEKLVDPDLRRKYNLDLFVNGCNVYNVLKRNKAGKILEKTLMCRVLAVNTFYNDKGSGFFDKDYLNDPSKYYNIALDEFERESGEKKTFDVLYAFTNQIENLVRNTKQRLRIILIGNTLDEASDILCAFNFIPEQFGRYKLKKKRCVIDYIEPTQKYKEMRAGSVAEILMPDASTFTNQIKIDKTLVSKQRLSKPLYIVKFSKRESDWFTVWNDCLIAKYNKEKSPVLNMKPYLDGVFNTQSRDNIIKIFDARGFKYRDLITFKEFQKNLELIKPRKTA